MKKPKKEPAFTPEDLKTMRKEKYRFCVEELGLTPKEAREWADRTVRITKETQEELRLD